MSHNNFKLLCYQIFMIILMQDQCNYYLTDSEWNMEDKLVYNNHYMQNNSQYIYKAVIMLPFCN